MPWPEKQREAIFLNTQREKGTKAAEETMQEAGYGDAKKTVYAGRKRHKKHRRKHRHAKPDAKAPLGQGGRFAALQGKLEQQGAKDSKGLAAAIGRKKLGKARFQKLAQKAR